jgi:large subunit ribosomal protein L37Ae
MTQRTRKTKHAGRYGVRYGTKMKKRINKVELLQRKKQKCPFCSSLGVKRESAGIWKCSKCGKKFASQAYYLE